MKIFVISDVHGFYDEMKQALDSAGFDPENGDHLLVSLGDIVDRGPKPVETLEYLMGLPRKVLVKGNHEDLAEEMMRTGIYHGHDISNGTWDTFRIFAAHQKGLNISRELAIFDWDTINNYVKHYSLWRKYLRECVNYFETDNYVFVHGWIPYDKDIYDVLPNWREATDKEWGEARWAKSPYLAYYELFDPHGKTIVCGHWHASGFRQIIDRQGWSNDEEKIDDTPYYGDHFIACDACTARSGFCNVVVLDDTKN